MDDVGTASVAWDEDVDDLIRRLSDGRAGEAGEVEPSAPPITPGL